MERRHAVQKLKDLVGQDLRSIAKDYNVTVFKANGNLNKGWAGQTVECYLGLPLNASRNPNLGSWELKVVPLTRKPGGRYTVKETMAITMLDPKEVKQTDFEKSHLFTKLRKIITVSREYISREEEQSKVLGYHEFELEGTILRDQVAKDYLITI